MHAMHSKYFKLTLDTPFYLSYNKQSKSSENEEEKGSPCCFSQERSLLYVFYGKNSRCWYF
jgi:hypothetical protein